MNICDASIEEVLDIAKLECQPISDIADILTFFEKRTQSGDSRAACIYSRLILSNKDPAYKKKALSILDNYFTQSESAQYIRIDHAIKTGEPLDNYVDYLKKHGNLSNSYISYIYAKLLLKTKSENVAEAIDYLKKSNLVQAKALLFRTIYDNKINTELDYILVFNKTQFYDSFDSAYGLMYYSLLQLLFGTNQTDIWSARDSYMRSLVLGESLQTSTKYIFELRKIIWDGHSANYRQKLINYYYHILDCRYSWIGLSTIFNNIPQFPHGITGVFISEKAKIGHNCIIFQNVTIGSIKDNNSKYGSGAPVIGNNVLIGAGSVIVGNIRIGNNVKIGAGATVFTNIPDNAVVVSKPPRILNHS